METVLLATTYGLLALIGFSMVRVIIGPSVEDRMIGLSLVSGNVLAILVVSAVRAGKAVFLDVALVYAILGYVGTLALAHYWRKDST